MGRDVVKWCIYNFLLLGEIFLMENNFKWAYIPVCPTHINNILLNLTVKILGVLLRAKVKNTFASRNYMRTVKI